MAPRAESVRRMLIYGDSNTYGMAPGAGRGACGRYPAEVRWPGVLAGALAGRWTVLEEGLPGRCIPQMDFEWASFEACLDQAAPLDLLAVMLGTNDYLSAARPDAGAVGERMERFIRRTREQRAEALDGADVLVIAPPYLDFGDDRFYGPFSTTSGVLSRALEEAAARTGSLFVDAGAWDLPLTPDGIHLAPAGHEKLARGMLRYMEERFGTDPVKE